MMDSVPRERYAALDQLAPGDRIWLDGAWRTVLSARAHCGDVTVAVDQDTGLHRPGGAARQEGRAVSRPRLLDLFCGAGGCSVGYHRAEFDVVGVDIEPQPRYPYEFHQADALEVLGDAEFLAGFDVIHASPPCQAYANVTGWRGSHNDHPDLLPIVIELLGQIGVPAIVENVPEAPIRHDWLLCGSQFGLRVRRHRAFQAVNWSAYDLLPPCHHRDLLPFMHKGERAYADAMGCDWMTNKEAREAIPPAYTELIGAQLLDHVRAAA